MTPTKARVVTAVLLLAVFVPAALWAPGWLWSLLIAAVVGAGAQEWARLSHFPTTVASVYAVLLALFAAALPMGIAGGWTTFQLGLILLAVTFWLLVAPLWLLGRWHAAAVSVRAAVGVVLLLPTSAALLYLHARGPAVLLGVMAVVWIADTSAYFAGRAFGRRKLAPSISPGKTWEGVAGALGALSLYAAGVAYAAALPVGSLVVMAAALLYFSVLGDLFESWIKRVSGLKDSGHVLPGHGGVLDRIDGLTSTLPLAAALIMWLEYTA